MGDLHRSQGLHPAGGLFDPALGGGLSRFMRGTVLEVLVQDYVRTAKREGL